MTQNEAEILALSALEFLGRHENLLIRFLDLSGLTASELAASAEQTAVLAAVLDFIMRNEPDLLAFAEYSSYPPEGIAAAMRILEGHSCIP